jgi:hypothetical protein
MKRVGIWLFAAVMYSGTPSKASIHKGELHERVSDIPEFGSRYHGWWHVSPPFYSNATNANKSKHTNRQKCASKAKRNRKLKRSK